MTSGATTIGRHQLAGYAGAARRRLRSAVESPLLQAIAKRVVIGVVVLALVTALSFILVSVTPGDPAREILGLQATPEQYSALRHALGLNLPLPEQYSHWVRHVLTGDLGQSALSSQDVVSLINARLPVTLSLMVGSLLVSLIVGALAGISSATRGGVVGRLIDGSALLGFALPPFWLGGVLISLFAVAVRWLPATGYVPFEQSPSAWLQSLVLPVITLALGGVAAVAKQTREAMLEALGSEYIRMARASGVPSRSLIYKHALKNVGPRIVTVLGLLAVGLLGGTVVVEVVFALPGLGSLAVNATTQHDIPVVQGVVLYFTAIVVIINLLVDIVCVVLNPKLKVQ